MRRYLSAVLLFSLVLTAPLLAKDKNPKADMSNAHTIYLGWIELMNPAEYHRMGYSSEQDYKDQVLDPGIESFRDACKAALKDREIKVSKSSADDEAANSDLYVKFTDAYYDYGYRLHIAVHFIDPKTNTEIASIPLSRRGAHFCGMVGCLQKEFDDVAREIAEKVGASNKK